MISLKLAVACALWLVPAGAAAASRTFARARPLVVPGLAVAAAATSAALTDEWAARRGDHMTESCLAALRAHDLLTGYRDDTDELAAWRERSVRLSGCAAPVF